MKRNKHLKRKKGINKLSNKRENYLAKYKELASLDKEYQKCLVCGKHEIKQNLQIHHPKGRIGNNILYYKYACSHCHTWIHENANESLKLGYLEKEYRS